MKMKLTVFAIYGNGTESELFDTYDPNDIARRIEDERDQPTSGHITSGPMASNIAAFRVELSFE